MGLGSAATALFSYRKLFEKTSLVQTKLNKLELTTVMSYLLSLAITHLLYCVLSNYRIVYSYQYTEPTSAFLPNEQQLSRASITYRTSSEEVLLMGTDIYNRPSL